MKISFTQENSKVRTLALLFIVILCLNYVPVGSKGTLIILLELLIIFFSVVANQVQIVYDFDYKLLVFLFIYEAMISVITSEAYNQVLYKNLFLLIAIKLCCTGINIEKTVLYIRNIGIVLSILGVYEFFTRNSLFYSLINIESKRYFASAFGSSSARVRLIFIHPIICGAFTVVFLILLINYPLKSRIANTVALLVEITCLIGTQSRSSFLAFFIVVFLNIITHTVNRTIRIDNMLFYLSEILIVAIFFGAAGSYLFDLINPVINRFLNGFSSTDSSNYLRTAVAFRELEFYLANYGWLEKIFGRGFSSAIRILVENPVYAHYSLAVDNQYITLLMDSGLVGLITYMLFIFYQIVCLIRCDQKLIKIRCLCIISLAVSSLFYDMLAWEMVCFILFVFVSLPVSNTDLCESNEQP